jgi:TMEM70/TMEM186/TMEM223 protein family
MLCIRNFNLKNITQSACIFKSANLWRPLQTSCVQKNSENQSKTDDKVQVYYGKESCKICKILINKIIIVRAVKVFTLTTSIVGIAAQPVLYEQAVKLGTSTPLIVGICGFVGIFTFITPVLINLITRKYVTEITYNEATGEYTAHTITFFLTRKQVPV